MIVRVQNRGTFLWTVISKTSTRINRMKIGFLESVTFQLHARVLSSEVARSLKSYGYFFFKLGQDRSQAPPW